MSFSSNILNVVVTRVSDNGSHQDVFLNLLSSSHTVLYPPHRHVDRARDMLGGCGRMDGAGGDIVWIFWCSGTLFLVQELQHQGIPGDLRGVCGAERAGHRAEHLRYREQTQALPDPPGSDRRALMVRERERERENKKLTGQVQR